MGSDRFLSRKEALTTIHRSLCMALSVKRTTASGSAEIRKIWFTEPQSMVHICTLRELASKIWTCQEIWGFHGGRSVDCGFWAVML